MIYEIRKFISYTLILALISTSSHPLYAHPPKPPIIDVDNDFNRSSHPPKNTLSDSQSEPIETDFTPSVISPFKALFGLASEGAQFAKQHPWLTLITIGSYLARVVFAGNEFRVNEVSLGFRSTPTAAFLNPSTNPGTLLTVWDGGATDSWWRVLTSSGFITAEQPFNAASGQASQPFAVPTSNNSAVVFYAGLGADIYDRVFNSSGSPVTPTQSVSGGTNLYPVGVPDGNGQYYAAWLTAGSPAQVLGQVVNESGVPILPSSVLLSPTGLTSTFPAIAISPSGKVGIVYHGLRESLHLFMQLFSGMYSPLVPETLVGANDTNYRAFADLAFLSDEKAVVTYEFEFDIGSVVLNTTTLTPLVGETVVNEFPALMNRKRPHVRVLPDTFIPAFPYPTLLYLWGTQAANYDVSARLLASDLTPLTHEFVVNQNTTGDQRNPFVATNPFSREVVVVWNGNQEGGVDNVYARYFNDMDLEALIREYNSSVLIPTSASGPSETSTISNTLPADDNPPSKAPVVIGASVGGAAGGGCGLIIVGGLIYKNCFSKKEKPDDEEIDIGAQPPSVHGSSPFAPSSTGFTQHTTFVGAINEDIYEIWETLSKHEVSLVQPLIAKQIEDSNFILGKGQYGKAYLGKNQKTQEIVAIKDVSGKIEESLQEGEILFSLQGSPHIMSLLDYKHYEPTEQTQAPHLFQVMPLAYLTDIRARLSHLSNDQREKLAFDTFGQLVSGLDYAHSRGFAHVDIKGDNLLFMKDGTLRIGDWGKARKEREAKDRITDYLSLGDISKFSPEAIALTRNSWGGTGEKVQSISGKAADMWAAGLYICELLKGDEEDFFSDLSLPLATKVSTWTYAHLKELVGQIDSLKVSKDHLNILRKFLIVEPEKRIKSSQAKGLLASSIMPDKERELAFTQLIKNSKKPTVQRPVKDLYPTHNPALYPTPPPLNYPSEQAQGK